MTAGRQASGSLARAATLLGVIAVAAAAPACGSSGATLEVQVSAPEGVVPEVTVNGPGSYFVTIHETTTLQDLPPGDYSVRVLDRRARVAHPVVDTIYAGTVTGTPTTLAKDASATVVVKFDQEPGSGRVWVPIAGEDRVISYTGDELASDSAPSVELQMPARSAPKALAVDARGNLWISLPGADQVVRITAGELGTTGSPTPSARIAVAQPQGLAFGEGGDLWVASASSKKVSRWGGVLDKPSQRTELAIEGSPRGIAFDKGGRMFLTTTAPAALLVYSAESLATPKPTPARIVTGTASRLVDPQTIALDGQTGAVWVTNGESGEAVRFDGAQLDNVIGEANLAPTASLTRPATGWTLDGFAFDNAGTAWFSTSEQSGARALTKAMAMQETPAFGEARSLFVGSARSLGLGEPAFIPPSRVSPIRR